MDALAREYDTPDPEIPQEIFEFLRDRPLRPHLDTANRRDGFAHRPGALE
jgi:hypothetical protein